MVPSFDVVPILHLELILLADFDADFYGCGAPFLSEGFKGVGIFAVVDVDLPVHCHILA